MAHDSSRLADFLPYLMSVTTNAVSDMIAGEYRARFGLKSPEWRVMAVLGDGANGACTQQALTRITLMDKVAVNRACKVLEGRGLVQRVPNERDGRSHLLELTEEGRSIHREVMPLALATERDLFEGFKLAEREQFRKLLDRIYSRAAGLSEDV